MVREIPDYQRVQDFQMVLVDRQVQVDLLVLNYQKDLAVLIDQADHLVQLGQKALEVPEVL